MNKKVKKGLKITGIVIASLLVILLIMPFLFKGKIIHFAKKELNNMLTAEADFDQLNISLIKHFPHITVGLTDIKVVGKDDFAGDTLAQIKKVSVTVDILSLFGSKYDIRRIYVEEPHILLKTNIDGKANWDIMKETGEEEEEEDTTASPFQLALKKLEIKKAYIVYDDQEAGIHSKLNNLNFYLSGDLSDHYSTLKTTLGIDEVDLRMGTVKYLSKLKFDLQAKIGADLDQMKFTVEDNLIKANAMELSTEGFVQMQDSIMNMDLKLNTNKLDFKDLLSMIPAIYMKGFEGLQADGKITLKAFAKGEMVGETYPAFGVDLLVENAMFKYPSVPKAVNNIQINTHVANPGGSLDRTVVDVKKFHLEMAGQPFDIRCLLKTPISDPDMDVQLKGKIDLTSVKEFYPFESGESLSGLFTMDVDLKGKLSSIEQERYQDFHAAGDLIMQGVRYTTKDLPPVDLSSVHLNFTSKYLDLKNCDVKIKQSDLSAKGKLENYLGYFLKENETLRGNLQVSSTYCNLNDLMGEETTSVSPSNTSSAPAESESAGVIVLPKNIDFNLQILLKKVIYDKYELGNVGGKIGLKDQQLNMQNLGLDVIGGKVSLSGFYLAKEEKEALADVDLQVAHLDIQKAFQTFDIIKELMPIAEKTQGNISLKTKLKTTFDQNMHPVLPTLTAVGELNSSKITIEHVNVLDKIAEATKYNKLKQLSLDALKIQFNVADGRVTTQPFPLKFGNTQGLVSGSMGLDQTLKYVVKMEVPRSELGGQVNQNINQATGKVGVSLPEKIKFDIKVGGTVTNPKISLDAKDMANDLKDMAKEKIEEVKEQAIDKAKEVASKAIEDAKKKADALIAQAQKQADLLRSEAMKQKDALLAEAQKQTNNLVAQAGSNPIQKKAAQLAGDKLMKEAKEKADKAYLEADKKATGILNKAKAEGDKLINDAQKTVQ